ncbi:MAG: hypothetical protein K5637_04615 [Lachnospiraceae bacterium]|nr:hypothetical protein [Lachnospiraceae bacterium]
MLVNVNSARAWQDSRNESKCDAPVNYLNMVSSAEDNLERYAEISDEIEGYSAEAKEYADLASKYAALSSKILEKDSFDQKAYEYAALADKYAGMANEAVTEIAQAEEEERLAAEEEARLAAEEEARQAAEEQARIAAAEEEARRAAEEEARIAEVAEADPDEEDNTGSEPETVAETPETEESCETETEEESEDNGWDGSVLTAYKGVNYGPSGKETYYNLDMTPVITLMRNLGYSESDYPYWIRDDGCKMFGDYIICAANLDERPRGTLVLSSLGMCMVCDTGGFASVDRYWIDIATNW